jgi:hypothetical protein
MKEPMPKISLNRWTKEFVPTEPVWKFANKIKAKIWHHANSFDMVPGRDLRLARGLRGRKANQLLVRTPSQFWCPLKAKQASQPATFTTRIIIGKVWINLGAPDVFVGMVPPDLWTRESNQP